MNDLKITIVYEYRGTTYNESSIVVPRIGESIVLDNFKELIVTDVSYSLNKGIAYLRVKNKK